MPKKWCRPTRTSKKVQDVRTQAERELKPLRDQLQPLEAKLRAGNATAKEQQDYRVLAQSLQEAGRKWTERSNAVLKPITEEIDQVIARVAQQQASPLCWTKKWRLPAVWWCTLPTNSRLPTP